MQFMPESVAAGRDRVIVGTSCNGASAAAALCREQHAHKPACAVDADLCLSHLSLRKGRLGRQPAATATATARVVVTLLR